MIRIVRSAAMLATGAALGAALAVTHRIMQETGKPLQEAIAEVPAELEKVITQLKIKALQLIETERATSTGGHQDAVERFAESVPGQQ